MNPVFMLDEIDKVSGVSGRSSAALSRFSIRRKTTRSAITTRDQHRLTFILRQTAQDDSALLRRMEIIPLPDSAKRKSPHRAAVLVRESRCGLGPAKVTIEDDAIRRIVTEYTREAGVRHLERQIGAVARKIAARAAALPSGEEPAQIVRAADLPDYLGPPRFHQETGFRLSRPGVATGVAWTESGGDVLFVEATLLPSGHHNLILTGQLGSVMQESARAALSHIRASAAELDPGRNPRQPRSARTCLRAILMMVLGGRRWPRRSSRRSRKQLVRQDVAMTGEITLSGLVLPVGGIREKALAARRYGIKTFVLPALNEADLAGFLVKSGRGCSSCRWPLWRRRSRWRSCRNPPHDHRFLYVRPWFRARDARHRSHQHHLVKRPGARIIARTSVPRWFFERSVRGPIELQPVEVDSGIAQIDSLHLDEDETAAARARFYADFDRRVEGESALLRAAGASVIVGDVPPLAFAALQAGRDSVDRARELHLGLDLRNLSSVRAPRAGGARPSFGAPTRARLTRCGCRSAGASKPWRGLRAPFPVARRSKLGRAEARRAMALDGDVPIVLASFGGHDSGLRYDDVARNTSLTLVTTDYEMPEYRRRPAGCGGLRPSCSPIGSPVKISWPPRTSSSPSPDTDRWNASPTARRSSIPREAGLPSTCSWPRCRGCCAAVSFHRTICGRAAGPMP
jgi:hypothetical protein